MKAFGGRSGLVVVFHAENNKTKLNFIERYMKPYGWSESLAPLTRNI
jgi:hypothetical protein